LQSIARPNQTGCLCRRGWKVPYDASVSPRFIAALYRHEPGLYASFGPSIDACLFTPVSMSFSVDSLSDDTVVIRMGEALDFRNADDFKSTFQTEIENGSRNFVLDFSDTAVLDSTGLGSIFSLYRQISPDDGQVAFADVSRPVQVVVQLTRTYKVFRQFPTVDAAEEALL
jgi:anti-sigma B factor antagonist